MDECEIPLNNSQVLEKATRLIDLRWINSEISSIDAEVFHNNKKLWKISLAGNKLEEIPTKLFQPLKYIKSIDLSNNFLDHIPEDTFDGLEDLKFLDLTLNFCINKKYGDENAARPLSEDERAEVKRDLKECGPERSEIDSIDGNFSTACRISMDFLALLEIIPNRIQISLKNCRTEHIDSKMLKKMTKLRIFQWIESGISSIEAGSFDNNIELEEISLAGNLLETLPDRIFEKNFKLNKLILRNNKLKSLGNLFKNLIKLEYLDLSHNQISTLPFFEQETKFVCIIPRISTVHRSDLHKFSHIFAKNRKLKELYLDENKIETFDVDATEEFPFKNNEELEILSFASNNLSELHVNDFIRLKKLKFLDLLSNACVNRRYGNKSAGSPLSAEVHDQMKNDVAGCKTKNSFLRG